MEYIIHVYVGNLVYKTLKLRVSTSAFASMSKNMDKATRLLKQKITEVVDTYSWTHFEYIGHGERAVVKR